LKVFDRLVRSGKRHSTSNRAPFLDSRRLIVI
jgi:hypothetical protein